MTLRTTLIAGYPGRRRSNSRRCLILPVRGFSTTLACFPFRQKRERLGFELDGQLEEAVRIERAQELRDVADSASCVKIAERIGRSYPVLVEGREDDGQLFGRAICQAPEVDGCTFLASGTVGQKRLVTIGDTLFYEMEEC